MIFSDILSVCLRVCELAFSILSASLTATHLHLTRNTSATFSYSQQNRLIYAEVIAALSILFSLLFLLPFTASLYHYHYRYLISIGIDIALSAALIAAFALLLNQRAHSHSHSHSPSRNSTCQILKANIAFLFLSSIFFFVSAVLSVYTCWNMNEDRNEDRNENRDGGQSGRDVVVESRGARWRESRWLGRGRRY
ncbi:uncharacterized protein L3040_005803 [Drepanopeziza brunnea f. sp. 'multigermtubi']|uniref:uncharacterized protein n=1 Tax=Drepanopeziza brunnea f. sp. 'multigermtubi' TaxID=698441 RepID=UPI002391FDD8|nr:hypothetical protein L3040_005803 [Drepanopeziza brunnea f. sp. 'multigermtubi']